MPDKACHRCRQWKSYSAFSKDANKRDGYRTICKDCTAIGNREWRRKVHDELLQKKREYYYANREAILRTRNKRQGNALYVARLKQEVFNHYGNTCYCCGVDDPRFLTIEHLNNDGHLVKHPAGKRVSGTYLYRCIIDTGFPNDVVLACYNCNCGRAYAQKGGKCPHKEPLPRDCDKSRYFIDAAERRVHNGDYDLPINTPEDVKQAEQLPSVPRPKERRKRRRYSVPKKQGHLF